MDHPNFGWFFFLANRVVTILDYKYYIMFLSSNTLKSRGSKLNHLHLSHLLTMWMWLVGSVAPQNKNNGKKNPQFFFFFGLRIPMVHDFQAPISIWSRIALCLLKQQPHKSFSCQKQNIYIIPLLLFSRVCWNNSRQP